MKEIGYIVSKQSFTPVKNWAAQPFTLTLNPNFMKHHVTEIELKNGAKGLLIDVPGATVMDFEFNFRAGEYLVDRTKWEVPHLMEHVLLGANEFIPKARTFQAEFEKNGAGNNASTGLYHITYEAECADFEWQR